MLVYFKKAAGGLFGNTAVYKLVELWDKKNGFQGLCAANGL